MEYTMERFIEETLVHVHEICTTDKYGQISKSTLGIRALFAESAEDVREFAKENPHIIRIDCYGSRYGNYYAVNIIDATLRKKCSDALSRNPNHIEALNTWY